MVEARVPAGSDSAGPSRSPTALALLLVAISVGFHVWWSGRVPLSPQEAYFWQLSRHLDLSFYDQPPLAPWTIRLFTDALGESERAIRLAAALHATIAAGFLFLAGRRLFGPGAALAALAASLATPIFALGQSFITSDAPLLAGWMAALYFTVRALQTERGAWLLAAGLAAGWASLGKYTGLLLVPQIALALAVDPRGRRILRGPWPWLGLALAAAVFSPVLVWNAAHGWASFAYHVVDRAAGLQAPQLDRIMRFLGLEALLVTPILGGVLYVAAVAAARRPEPAFRICAVFALPVLAIFLVASPFTWVRGNWSAPGYPTAILASAGFLLEHPRMRSGLALVAVAVAAAASAYLHAAVALPVLPFPAKQVTTAGWEDLARRVKVEQRRIPGPSFVLGCGAKAASALAYYLPERPETFSSEAMGEDGLQYAYWFRPDGIQGREGILVMDRRERGAWCRERAAICTDLQRLRSLVIRRNRAPVTTFELYRCRYPATAPLRAR